MIEDPVRLKPTPYDGWPLEGVLRLNAEILAPSMYFSVLRRQVLFLSLAFLEIGDERSIKKRLCQAASEVGDGHHASSKGAGRALVTLRPKRILKAVLGREDLPKGLVGTLARLGRSPLLAPKTYQSLTGIYIEDTPLNRRRRKTLAQISGPVTGMAIRVAQEIDPALQHPRVLTSIHIHDAPRLNSALTFLRAHCRAATDEALHASLSIFGPARRINAWFRSWAERCDQFPSKWPVLAQPELVALDTAEKLRDAARRFKNCLRDRVPECLLGRYIYIEHVGESPDQEAIAELRATSHGWLLTGVFGRENARVPDDLVEQMHGALRAAGVNFYAHAEGDARQIAAAASLLQIYDLPRFVQAVPDPILEALERDCAE
ncbi:hypothetical protein [Alsobacter sp. SYSU BS001988]